MITNITKSAICNKGTMARRIEFNTTCKPVIFISFLKHGYTFYLNICKYIKYKVYFIKKITQVIRNIIIF